MYRICLAQLSVNSLGTVVITIKVPAGSAGHRIYCHSSGLSLIVALDRYADITHDYLGVNIFT